MPPDAKPLERFFAVTLTSVYRISLEDERPIVEKIALRRNNSIVTIKGDKSAVDAVVITPVALFMCAAGRDESVIIDTSSFLVALFLEEDEALQCAQLHDLVALDPRHSEMRQNVVRAIGIHHPCFLIRKPPGIFSSGNDDTSYPVN